MKFRQEALRFAHIKTDSIKIPNATPEIIQFCLDFAKKYDYVFEHEATYEKMCLVNNAVYIAKYAWAEKKTKKDWNMDSSWRSICRTISI